MRADDEPLLLRADDDPPLRDRVDDDPLLLRADDDRLPLRDVLLRDDEPLRVRDVPPVLRDDDDERELDERDRDAEAGLRSFAGISALTTSFVSRGICFATKSYMRSSSRRIDFASLAVSLSLTLSASARIAV